MSKWLETDLIRLWKGLTIEIRHVELISIHVEYRSFRLDLGLRQPQCLDLPRLFPPVEIQQLAWLC